jgi:uncharacterized membrane protein
MLAALVLGAGPSALAQTRPEGQPEVATLEADDLVGIWTRPVENAPEPDAVEGFDLRREGIYHLIGRFSMNGLTWRLEGDMLRLATNTERYPEPQGERYRVVRAQGGSLELAGDGAFAGSYEQRRRSPTDPLPRSRAAAIDANLAAYRRLSGRSAMGDSATDWEAYLYQGEPRLVREWLELEDYGTELIHYYVERRRDVERRGGEVGLFHYRAEKSLAPLEAERAEERDEIVVLMSFGKNGKLADGVRVVNGEAEELDAWEAQRVKAHFGRLLGQVEEAALGEPRVGFDCRGNEPFWNLELSGQRARLNLLGEAEEQTFRGEPQGLEYLRPPLVLWRGRSQAGVRDLIAFVTRESCRDTMAEEGEGGRFSHAVRVSLPDGRVLAGCCNLPERPGARER